MIHVSIPIRIESEPNKRGHWSRRAERMREHRQSAWYALKAGAKHTPELLPCVVTITRVAPRELDDDNLSAGCKGVRDGVADWLTLGNDRHSDVEWRYAQRKGGVREYGCEVRIAPKGAFW